MRRIWRLLLYVRPYALYSMLSVVLMAVVGAMAAFRILLIKPIFENVLSPQASSNILVFPVPHLGWTLNLNFLVPSHFHNAWSVVAYALVVSALVKSVCDYAGTYLANYAGYGMITDLRNDLYNAVLRRSVAFFQKHTTGTLLSTLINDIERVQFAMSSVLSDFLQQLFTLLFTIGRGGCCRRKTGLGAAAVCADCDLFCTADWPGSAAHDAHGAGQAGGDSEHPSRDDYGKSDCEGVRDGAVGDEPLSQGGETAVPREPEVGERAGDQFAADGCAGFDRDRSAAAAGTGADSASRR